MKKYAFIFIILFTFTSSTFAYELSQKDKDSLLKVKNLFWNLSTKKDKSWFDDKIIKVDKIVINYKNNIRFWLIFNEIKNELINISNSFNIKEETNNNQFEIDFFNTYGKEITTDLKVSEKCTMYYDFIDKIALENDFPTALIIATWSKEFNCQLSNPANGWGPFQITSQYYKPGDITLDELKIAIENFINFSKNKWNYFNTNIYVNYKDRFGSENLAITYSNYTLRELQIHSILYNGVNSTTTLTGNSFANNNLNQDIVGNSDGVVTRFLKILNWKNNK